MRDLEPQEVYDIVKWYRVAMHCLDFHTMEVVDKPNGEALISICADNCISHFEIILRERPTIEITPEKCFVNLVSCLFADDARCELHPNGFVVTTAEASYQVTMDAPFHVSSV